MSLADDESIPDIVKEIDSVQETTQHSVVLEHRWSIWDICDLINEKSPGEKIESDQFSYKSHKVFQNEDFDLKFKEPIRANNPNPVKAHNTEIMCERLINDSQWRIELRHSVNDIESLSICTLFYLNLSEFTFLGQNNFSLIFKLNLYLLNAEANLLFKKQAIEETLDLSEIIAKNLRHNKSKFVKEFQVSKFCKTTELLGWLTRNKSNDICIIFDLKIYRQLINISYGSGFDTKSRIKSKVSRNKNAASFFSHSLSNFSSASSASWFLTDPNVEPKREKISQLSKSFKTAWIIKNWRNFLVLNSSPHTFLAETDLSKLLNNGEGLTFTKLKTKLFNLLNTESSQCEFDGVKISKSRVEKLLEEIKWKLQLYPNGYNKELEKNISLFVNFCSLNGELKELSSKLNETKFNLETLYDSDKTSGLIILVDSPSDPQTELTKKKKNLNEIFVKASFHISIIDSTGKKVDKCHSDKQLFELFGSWGYKEYMSVKELLGSRNTYLTDNNTKLTLNCKIVLYYTLTKKSELNCTLESKKEEKIQTLINKPGVLSCTKNIIKAPLEESNSLLFDMRRLLKHSSMYDLIVQASFNINDPRPESFKQFKAHKLILSMRSQVFEKMFMENNCQSSVSLKQDKNNLFVLNITDFEAFIVEIFLNYLYTDSLDVDLSGKRKMSFLSEESESSEEDSNKDEDKESWLKTSLQNDLCMHVLIELFKIADKYCVHRLKRICEQELEAQINVDTVVELLIVAYLYNSNRLKNLCFEVLTNNLSIIICQPNWTHLEKSYPSLLAEAFKVIYVKKYNG